MHTKSVLHTFRFALVIFLIANSSVVLAIQAPDDSYRSDGIQLVGFDASETKSPTWPKPTTLISQVDDLKEVPKLQEWASVTSNILALLSQTPMSSQDVDKHIELLDRQRQLLPNIAQSLWQAKTPESIQQASDVSRMNYRLGRRILVWKGLRVSYLSSLDRPTQTSISKSAFQRLSFDGLDPRWVEYLMLDELKKQLVAIQPNEKEQRETARKILGRIYSPVLDANQASFVREIVDPSVVEFLKGWAAEPVDYLQLIGRLEQYDSKPSSYAGYYVNDQYHNLLWSPHPEDQPVVEHLETHYRNANFRLSISEVLMNRLIPELPTMTEPVSESVGGARVSGQSHVSNRIRVNMIPNPNVAMVQLETSGFVQADTIARTRTFKIQNEGQASFEVFKRVAFGVDGIDASASPFSQALANQNVVRLQSTLDNVPVFGAMARKMAARKLRDDAPKTNLMFKNKVSESAEQRVEQEIHEKLTRLREFSRTNLLQPLIAMELEPQPVQLSSSDSQFIMRYRLAGLDQMAANSARPQDSGSSLISFQIHQSAINNAVARLGLNGNKFDSDSLREHLQEVIGLEPKEDKLDVSDKKAEFTFSAFDPIRIDFEDERFNVVLNLRGLKVGERGKTWKNVSLTASYRAESDGMQIRLVQDDNLTQIKGRKLRVGDKAAISTVMKVLFKKEYTFNTLPKKMYDKLKGDQLYISQLITSNGWISVSMDDRFKVESEQPRNRVGGGLRRILNRR